MIFYTDSTLLKRTFFNFYIHLYYIDFILSKISDFRVYTEDIKNECRHGMIDSLKPLSFTIHLLYYISELLE